jgi:transcription elongation factor GreA
MEKLHVSQEGLDKMKAELGELNKKRMVVAAAIEHARSLGDLSENAEYHSAKEAQAMLHAKIGDLEDKISRAAVVDESKLDASKALLGAMVRVRNLKTKKEVVYKLVSPVEADMASGKISVQSPVGRALLGKSAGETAIAQIPAGELKLEVLEISRD